MRRVGLLLIAMLVLAVAPATASPFEPPRDEWHAANDLGFDYWSDGTRVRVDDACLDIGDEQERAACSLAAFQERPFVVIAFIDTGINPYHQDFRAPEFVHDPTQYIEGYPAGTPGLELSFDVADTEGYDAAVAADQTAWNQVPFRQLRWIPGTRIIGGYGATSSSGSAPWILDNNGHGTGVASVAAGQFYGSNPNALIVAVEGLGDFGLNWATSQPWIDIVSNSWGFIANAPAPSSNQTREATRRGQSVLFAAGNGATNTNSFTVWDPIEDATGVPDPCKCKTPDSNPSMTSPYGGPSWILTVGAASPINGQPHWWHSIPVDVASFGSKWRAASRTGVHPDESRDFGGTSCAAPTTAGVLASVIQTARELFGDTVGGQRPGAVVAQAGEDVALPADGPLADGQLTRAEAEEIVKKTAFPVEFDPDGLQDDVEVYPTTEAYYVHKGYGLVYRESKARALAVLLGDAPMPDRSDVDTWMETVDTARDVVWENYP
jgi:hypothetical protein